MVQVLGEGEEEGEASMEGLTTLDKKAQSSSREGDKDREGEVGVGVETAEASVEEMEGLTRVSGVENNDSSSVTSSNGSGGKAVSASSSSSIVVPARAKVVGIIRRNWRQYAGSLDTTNYPEQEVLLPSASTSTSAASATSLSVVFRAVDKKVPPIRILINSSRRDELTASRVLVSLDEWPVGSDMPLGHYVKRLGKDGDKDVETAVFDHLFVQM